MSCRRQVASNKLRRAQNKQIPIDPPDPPAINATSRPRQLRLARRPRLTTRPLLVRAEGSLSVHFRGGDDRPGLITPPGESRPRSAPARAPDNVT